MGSGSPPSLPTDGRSSKGAGHRPMGCLHCGVRQWRFSLMTDGVRRKTTKVCGSCERRWTGDVEEEEKPAKGDRILVLDYSKARKGVI